MQNNTCWHGGTIFMERVFRNSSQGDLASAYVTLLVWIWSLRGAHCKRGKLTECGLNLFNYSDMSYLCGIIPWRVDARWVSPICSGVRISEDSNGWFIFIVDVVLLKCAVDSVPCVVKNARTEIKFMENVITGSIRPEIRNILMCSALLPTFCESVRLIRHENAALWRHHLFKYLVNEIVWITDRVGPFALCKIKTVEMDLWIDRVVLMPRTPSIIDRHARLLTAIRVKQVIKYVIS